MKEGRKEVAHMKTPREKKPSLHLMTLEQARTLIEIGKGHAFEVPLILGLGLGLRAGELLAVQWNAINWQDGSLRVHQTWHYSQGSLVQPSFQSAKHPRVILLPQGVITCLQEHAARQQQERARAGGRWQPLDLVICTKDGMALSPDRLTPPLQDLLRQVPFPVLRFHELRHTTTHLLLLAGLAPQIVGEILGIGRQVLPYGDHWPPVSHTHYENARQTMNQLFFTR
jgi:integrase